MNGNLSWGMFREKLYSDPENCSNSSLKKYMGRDSLLLFQYIAHCINKAFVCANSTVNHETFLTDGCKPT